MQRSTDGFALCAGYRQVKSQELIDFEYYLERNLTKLAQGLSFRSYKHQGYRTFTVDDNKRRNISVASIRDRVVHRLLYEHFVKLFDHTFDFAVWSCRRGKGLLEAIKYCHNLTRKYENKYYWRADIKKFFESVDHVKLFSIITIKIHDEKLLWLIWEIIQSYNPGISIGNLTSQIFSNIYLNEFDRFVRHKLRPLGYLRYGDDFILFDNDLKSLEKKRHKLIASCHSVFKLGLFCAK